ncbi:GNAT family N-acetyltransferase [Exiguobacterium flavidum]|uniref:GNAT family N-acetyltransferase n=1 Tax=Exiguobacterium flavidum TaxID=2184695 RepID=UPI000DF84FBE|nr:GNAT family N-acetyltransferase [Exiguobacterium flavidum]
MTTANSIVCRPYETFDFNSINALNAAEGWTNLVERSEEVRKAFENSNCCFVALDEDKVVGYVRALTDGEVTLYVCELLIAEAYRGQGIGKELLRVIHAKHPRTRIEMLASSTSRTYYESNGYRPFYGFRKTILE